MKRRNNKKTIMQQGGLMIEALAMLGLIAVVTPTMYKKSAERTMEVEDINSATTIRTIMNAANDYVGANYSTIISDMNKAEGDANKYRPITRAQIEPYLPYGFNMNKALYNYDFPELAIAKNDNNLTTFALFPAKANADNGIGQERTSRIASLVGASGGYVTESGKARGIGGIWKLEGDDFKKVFPTSGDGANEYSIVTASADTINAATGNEIDMDKYLQRGRDDPNDTSTLWKNTMRTDLYMGINKSDDDVYKNEAPNNVQEKQYSIRNIKSLIVGVEKASQDGTTDLPGYGLYIEGSDAGGLTGNPNAFIRGSLRAAQEQFYVTENKLGYGIFDDSNFKFEIDKETGDTKTIGTLQAAQEQFYVTDTKLGYGNMEDGNFRVEMDKETGNTRIRGTLENDKNVALANSLGNWDTVTIGAVDRYPSRTDGNHAITIKSSATGAPYGKLTLFDDDVMYVQNKGNNDNAAPDNDRIVMLKGGVKELPGGATVPTLSYNTEPTFPLRVGANAKFEGLVAAGQLDTQKIRAASLSVGSEKIDDANKWMTVDKDGVIIRNPKDMGEATGSGTQAVFNKDNIFLRLDDEDQGFMSDTAHPMQLNLRRKHGSKNYVTELYGFNTDIRGRDQMTVSGGGVILQATSDMPSYWDTPDSDNQMLKDTVDKNTLMLRNDSMQAKLADQSLTVGSREDTNVEFVNVGDMNTNAGVNIIALRDETDKNKKFIKSDANKKVVTIEEGATPTNNHNSDSDDGTVYIRKGYVEVHGENVALDRTQLKAFEGKGIIAASRLVANNVPTEGPNGQFTELVSSPEGSHRYDTYMVNPAYTSVMHDIKLTTRGGARLSDVLPDFINKGIYVVNNTILESEVGSLDNIKTYSDVTGKASSEADVNLGSADAWASPLLGAVPAPQCPPGYGRVITLNPAGFQVAQAGSLHASSDTTDASKLHDSGYYVAPYTPSKEQAKPGSEPTYDLVDIKSTVGDTKGSVTGQTAKYVLTAASSATESSQLATPLVFQQSTWLKSMVRLLCVNRDKCDPDDRKNLSYVQGWAAIMGFLYPGAQYQGFIDNTSKSVLKDKKKDVYWNLFPVARGTLEGYATVYCYFDRTNTVTGDFMAGYGNYVDTYDYMQTMTGLPTGYEKKSGPGYKERLNDPNMTYDDMW